MPLFSFGGGGGRSLFSMVKSGIGAVASGINKTASTLGNVASGASSVLGTLSNIASNPLVKSVAGSLGYGGAVDKFASATQAGANLAQRVGGVAGQVRDISSPATYFNQPAVPAVRNALERAKGIVGDTKDIFAGFRGNPLGSNPATYSPFSLGGARLPMATQLISPAPPMPRAFAM